MTTTQTRPTHAEVAEAVEILFSRAVQAHRSLFDAMLVTPILGDRKAIVREANSALSLYASIAEFTSPRLCTTC